MSPVTIYRADGCVKSADTQMVGDAPVGSIQAYAGATIPTDWRACNGAVLKRADYPDLFAALATTWNTGSEGGDEFRLPDLRGRAIIGVGQGQSLTNRALSAVGGEEKHQLTAAELASHAHPASDSPTYPSVASATAWAGQQVAGGSTYWVATMAPGGGLSSFSSTRGAGGDVAHENMPPYVAVNWIIRVYPPSLTAASPPALVTSLPASPRDGQEVYYLADAANGVLWHLRYRAAASAYKWESVGGSGLFATGSGANQNLTTSPVNTNCALAIPLAGVYDVRGVCQFAGGSNQGYAMYANGAGLTNSTLGYMEIGASGTNHYEQGEDRYTLTAGTLTMAVSGSVAAGFATSTRRLWANPVRVG